MADAQLDADQLARAVRDTDVDGDGRSGDAEARIEGDTDGDVVLHPVAIPVTVADLAGLALAIVELPGERLTRAVSLAGAVHEAELEVLTETDTRVVVVTDTEPDGKRETDGVVDARALLETVAVMRVLLDSDEDDVCERDCVADALERKLREGDAVCFTERDAVEARLAEAVAV